VTNYTSNYRISSDINTFKQQTVFVKILEATKKPRFLGIEAINAKHDFYLITVALVGLEMLQVEQQD
jgi:hypothetical protein